MWRIPLTLFAFIQCFPFIEASKDQKDSAVDDQSGSSAWSENDYASLTASIKDVLGLPANVSLPTAKPHHAAMPEQKKIVKKVSLASTQARGKSKRRGLLHRNSSAVQEVTVAWPIGTAAATPAPVTAAATAAAPVTKTVAATTAAAATSAAVAATTAAATTPIAAAATTAATAAAAATTAATAAAAAGTTSAAASAAATIASTAPTAATAVSTPPAATAAATAAVAVALPVTSAPSGTAAAKQEQATTPTAPALIPAAATAAAAASAAPSTSSLAASVPHSESTSNAALSAKSTTTSEIPEKEIEELPMARLVDADNENQTTTSVQPASASSSTHQAAVPVEQASSTPKQVEAQTAAPPAGTTSAAVQAAQSTTEPQTPRPAIVVNIGLPAPQGNTLVASALAGAGAGRSTSNSSGVRPGGSTSAPAAEAAQPPQQVVRIELPVDQLAEGAASKASSAGEGVSTAAPTVQVVTVPARPAETAAVTTSMQAPLSQRVPASAQHSSNASTLAATKQGGNATATSATQDQFKDELRQEMQREVKEEVVKIEANLVKAMMNGTANATATRMALARIVDSASISEAAVLTTGTTTKATTLPASTEPLVPHLPPAQPTLRTAHQALLSEAQEVQDSEPAVLEPLPDFEPEADFAGTDRPPQPVAATTTSTTTTLPTMSGKAWAAVQWLKSKFWSEPTPQPKAAAPAVKEELTPDERSSNPNPGAPAAIALTAMQTQGDKMQGISIEDPWVSMESDDSRAEQHLRASEMAARSRAVKRDAAQLLDSSVAQGRKQVHISGVWNALEKQDETVGTALDSMRGEIDLRLLGVLDKAQDDAMTTLTAEVDGADGSERDQAFNKPFAGIHTDPAMRDIQPHGAWANMETEDGEVQTKLSTNRALRRA
mmetsp:Transcript_54462/g.129801  ORF Transcript_54462/g.129801 Transcript_54462/m.129801 type:complete len:896 (+) Transcript_54462:104-2791(+)